MSTISQRATAALRPQEMAEHERSLSEQYRVVAKAWVEADANARLLEELKTTRLEKQKQDMILAEGDMPDSHAERRVKASPEWEVYITGMVAARTEANLKKAQLEYIRMRFAEAQSVEANVRHEARLTR